MKKIISIFLISLSLHAAEEKYRSPYDEIEEKINQLMQSCYRKCDKDREKTLRRLGISFEENLLKMVLQADHEKAECYKRCRDSINSYRDNIWMESYFKMDGDD